MGTVINFIQAYRAKTWSFEKKMLKEISLNDLKKNIQSYFIDDLKDLTSNSFYAEQMCLEIAVEAFLLGAKYSRFGYFGEKKEYVTLRAQSETSQLLETLKECLYVGKEENEMTIKERDNNLKCEFFIKRWWEEGFDRGAKRLKLRLK